MMTTTRVNIWTAIVSVTVWRRADTVANPTALAFVRRSSSVRSAMEAGSFPVTRTTTATNHAHVRSAKGMERSMR